MNYYLIVLYLISIISITYCEESETVFNYLDDYDFEIWNIGAKNLFIPFESMSYTSKRLITIPFKSRRQISKIKAVIQPENAKLIDSIYLFRCVKSSESFSDSINEKNVWFEDRIITNHENERHNCWRLLAVWTENDSLNKTIMSLPKNIGIPINAEPHNEKYLLFEINYKHSDLMVEFADYSGFQLYVRKYNTDIDADIVTVGSVPDYRLFIPPKMKEWTVSGNCYKECLQNHLFVDGFNVLDVIHYSRKNLLKELTVEVLNTENALNNKYEEMSTTLIRSTANKTDIGAIDLKLGDTNQIRIKCTFSSTNYSRTVLGGMSDESAQCMAWIVYYPKIQDFDVCLSSLSLTTIMSITGIVQLEEQWRNENDFDIIIKSEENETTETLEEYLLNKNDWDYRRIHRSKYVAQFAKQTAQCNWKRSFFDQVMKK